MNISLRRIITAAIAAGCVAFSSWGVPARHGIVKLTQPDGTEIDVSLCGDEHFHFYRTVGGDIALRAEDGFIRYAAIDAAGALTCGEAVGLGAAPAMQPVGLITDAIGARRDAVLASRAGAPSRVAPAAIPGSFPTLGEVRGLAILAEYQDLKFTEGGTPEHFDAKFNKEGYSSELAYGSVRDYFNVQSGGRFTPVFDVVGPVTLPHERAYYGTNENIVDHVRDACVAADAAGVDFSKYDVNDDGFVDFVIVIYPGHGEAQGGPAESFWPAMKDLSYDIFDLFDGMSISNGACFCELKGNSGTTLDGVGTVCHEFSHILGLPDIYDARYSGGFGMGDYDMMDHGAYNLDSRVPSGYTAMDRYTLGWLEPRYDVTGTDISLRPLEESGDAIFIVNPENPDEYFTLENRQQTGWDAGIPGHGLVISAVHYERIHWKKNTVNSPASAGYEHVQIVAADNVWSDRVSNAANDPYPGGSNNTEFSAASVPAAKWRSTPAASISWAVSNIREDEDGTVRLDIADRSGIDGIEAETAVIAGGAGCITAPAGAEVYTVQGVRTGTDNLQPGIYIVRSGARTVKVAVK